MRTLFEAINAFAYTGFTEHFAVRSRTLCGLETGTSFDAHEVVIRAFERFEGISDPDDMSIVYAIESQTGLRGTLTDAFGVYSNPVISDFINRVPIQRFAEPGRGIGQQKELHMRVALIGIGGRVGSRRRRNYCRAAIPCPGSSGTRASLRSVPVSRSSRAMPLAPRCSCR